MNKIRFITIFVIIGAVIVSSVAFSVVKAAPKKDDAPLQISNIKVDFMQNMAAISWVTNRESEGTLEYGLASGVYDYSISGGDMAVANNGYLYTIYISVEEGVVYYYKITAVDSEENIAESKEKTFRKNRPDHAATPAIPAVPSPGTGEGAIPASPAVSGTVYLSPGDPNNETAWGELTYKVVGSTFDFTFTGIAPVANDWYALVVGEDPLNDPETAVILHYPRSGGDTGEINIEKSIELDRDLKNVEVWLVLGGDLKLLPRYNGYTEWVGWQSEKYLFGDKSFNYNDKDVHPDGGHDQEITFSDNFDDGDANGWWLGYSQHTPWVDGNWRVEDLGLPHNGVLVQDNGADHFIALVQNIQNTNQKVETQIMTKQVSGYGGVTVWFQDDDNWVEILMYPAAGWIRIYENINGTKTAFPYGVYPQTFYNSTWYTLKVTANSTTGDLDVYVDDVYLFTHNVLTTNRSGLSGVNVGNSGAYFDNFILISQ